MLLLPFIVLQASFQRIQYLQNIRFFWFHRHSAKQNILAVPINLAEIYYISNQYHMFFRKRKFLKTLNQRLFIKHIHSICSRCMIVCVLLWSHHNVKHRYKPYHFRFFTDEMPHSTQRKRYCCFLFCHLEPSFLEMCSLKQRAKQPCLTLCLFSVLILYSFPLGKCAAHSS